MASTKLAAQAYTERTCCPRRPPGVLILVYEKRRVKKNAELENAVACVAGGRGRRDRVAEMARPGNTCLSRGVTFAGSTGCCNRARGFRQPGRYR